MTDTTSIDPEPILIVGDGPGTPTEPDQIAETYWPLPTHRPSDWTAEVDVRAAEGAQ